MSCDTQLHLSNKNSNDGETQQIKHVLYVAKTKMLRLQCKAKNGTHLIQGLTSASSVQELKDKVEELTGVPCVLQKIMVGFPPSCLDLHNGDIALKDCPVKSGDTLIVEEERDLMKTKASVPKFAAECSDKNTFPQLTRHVVPADNSCLFTSIHYVVEGGICEPNCAPEMRNLIAQIVASDPDSYTEAVLGKSNWEYCNWICQNDTWGGAIEISILSKFYCCEICVVDTQTARIDRFGEDVSYKNRVFLIYNGIHYDPLERQFEDPEKPPQTIFSTADDAVLAQALELGDEARSKHQFTDLNRFTLHCIICQKGLVGQIEAWEHAKETGHTNFGEV